MAEVKILLKDPEFPDKIYKCVSSEDWAKLYDESGNEIEYDTWCANLVRHYNFVYQDKFGLGGNCQSAVMASLLNMELPDIPWFAEGLVVDGKELENSAEIFNDRIDEFLEQFDLALYWYEDSPEIQRYIREDFHNLAYQVSGKSPRGFEHVVIYINGEMVHDPHPEGGGVIPKYYGFVVKI